MLLLQNGELYAPQPMGRMDLLLSPEKILLIRPKINPCQEYETQVLDCAGCVLCPALIDQHIHLTGGGGEEGPASRIPQIMLSEILMAGIGTVVGLLGADGVTRSVASLLAKVKALSQEGLTAYLYTGSYGLPTDTLTGKVINDIVFVDQVLGAGEVAISDYRSTHPSLEMLRALAWEVKMGGMIGGKAGILHLHVGDGKKGLAPLTDLIEESNFPMSMFVPTHLNRSKALFDDALRYGRKGGFLDLTAGESDETGYAVAKAVRLFLEQGVPLTSITFTSDAGGSNPGSPDGRGHVSTLFVDFAACVQQEGLPLETALALLTENPARRLALFPRKGRLQPGSDADVLILEKGTLALKHLVLGGCLMVENGSALKKGKYEA